MMTCNGRMKNIMLFKHLEFKCFILEQSNEDDEECDIHLTSTDEAELETNRQSQLCFQYGRYNREPQYQNITGQSYKYNEQDRHNRRNQHPDSTELWEYRHEGQTQISDPPMRSHHGNIQDRYGGRAIYVEKIPSNQLSINDQHELSYSYKTENTISRHKSALNEASENCDEGTRGQSAVFVPDIPVCDITSGQGLHFNSAVPTDDRPPPPRYEEIFPKRTTSYLETVI